MATRDDIARLAAAELASVEIDSLDDPQNASERTMAALLDLAFRETLAASVAWLAARTRVSLSRDAGSEATPAFGFTYRYRLPSNFIRMVRVYNSAYHWEREGDYILTDDAGPLNVQYIREITPEEADPMLVSAAAARLAWRAARRTADSDGVRAQLLHEWRSRLAEAEGVNGAQRAVTDRYPSEEMAISEIDPAGARLTAVERARL